ncbi:hypothetical protein LJC56_07610 [Christensenellaceae bacterium OttesenSCG-928-K19]|nr:hypothetical protein [Christensenellaceae bacterium OttesenSCG-928-K19]
MPTLAELYKLLGKNNCAFELIHHETELLSTQTDVRYLDIRKAALVFILESRHGYAALIVSAGNAQKGFAYLKETIPQLADYCLTAKRNVSLITDYAAGAVPLIGHGLPCLFDSSLLEFDYIYGGSGDIRATLKIAPGDVKRMNNILHEI